MKCPKCNSGKNIAVVKNALIINKGPEGPLHEVICTKCNWKTTITVLPINTKRRCNYVYAQTN